MAGTYNPINRPTGSNADEWAVFVEDCRDAEAYLAVQIAEAIEQAEREACERTVNRMGWDEIKAFQEELRLGQDIYEDAGGYMMRAIKRLFDIKSKDPVVTYRDAAQAMIESLRKQEG